MVRERCFEHLNRLDGRSSAHEDYMELANGAEAEDCSDSHPYSWLVVCIRIFLFFRRGG
jgi:hypothetical protein